MRRVVDVELLVFFASVLLASSLVISDKKAALPGKQEHPHAPVGRAGAELLQAGHNALHGHQRRAGLDKASLTKVATESKAASHFKAGATSKAESLSHATLKVDSSTQKAIRRSAPADEHADHLLADILGNMHVSGFIAKTKVLGSTSDPLVVRAPPRSAPTVATKSEAHPVPAAPAANSKPPARPAAKARPVLSEAVKSLRITHGSQDHPLNDVIGRLVPSSMSGGRVGRFEAWESESRKEGLLRYVIKGFFSVLIWAVLCMMLGLFYHHEKQHPPKLDPEGVNVSLHDRERLDRQRWRFGLFECLEVPSLCLFSVFCAPIRWADTMRMSGFMHFFPALMLVVGLTVLSSISFGLAFLGLVGVCVHFRHRMRQKFYIRGSESYMADVLAFVFCPWCSIVQEARQIEEAYLARHASVRDEYRQRHSAVVWLSAKKV